MKNLNSRMLTPALISLLAAPVSLYAQGVEGTVSQEKLGYQVQLFGDLVLGPDRLMSNALMQGRGQHLLQEKNILVTSDKIVEMSPGKFTLQVNAKKNPSAKKFERTLMEFAIQDATKICRSGKPVSIDSFKKGEMVTVSSEPGKSNALSVRYGPMLFGGADTGVAKLKKFDCSS
jgi:hypothetical protein